MAGHNSGPLTRVLKIDELKFARCNLIKVAFQTIFSTHLKQ
jgi:hypothetical protein